MMHVAATTYEKEKRMSQAAILAYPYEYSLYLEQTVSLVDVATFARAQVLILCEHKLTVLHATTNQMDKYIELVELCHLIAD